MKKITTGVRGGLKKDFLVDDEAHEWLNAGNWICQDVRDHHYAFFNEYIPKYKRRRVQMHRLIVGEPKGMDVDHVNGKTLDNRIENLRVCTRQENFLNSGPKKNGTSGYKWVSWNKKDRRWKATVSKDRKQYHGGNHTSKRSAIISANKLAKELHGEYAYQNPLP